MNGREMTSSQMKHGTEKTGNYGAEVNANRIHKVGSLTPCCPPPWTALFGRSPDDAVGAVRAQSRALGSKASGGTLRGKTGWGSLG